MNTLELSEYTYMSDTQLWIMAANLENAYETAMQNEASAAAENIDAEIDRIYAEINSRKADTNAEY